MLSKPTVIVHVVERFSPGGIETLVHDLVTNSSSASHIVSLWGTRQQVIDGWPRMAEHGGYLHAMDKGDGARLTLVTRLARLFLRLGATHIFAHHMGPLVYAGAASKLIGLRNFMYVEHDCWHYDLHVSDRRLLQICARLFKPRMVAVNDEIAHRLRELTPVSDVQSIAPGVSTVEYVPADKAQARQKLGLGTTTSDRPLTAR